MDDFVHHMADDKLVDWGWHPGGDRKPVPIPKEDTVTAVKAWVAAGAPCPASWRANVTVRKSALNSRR